MGRFVGSFFMKKGASMNNIKIFLKTSGSLAEMYKDFALFEGSYRSANISIYVPKVMLSAGSGETDAVKTGAILTAPNGAKTTTESYSAAYSDDETVNGVEYSVYTQVVPQVYTQYSGTQKLVVNVVVMSQPDEEGEAGTIQSITTSQTVPFTVLPSARLGQDGSDPPLDPSQVEQIEGQINALGKRVATNEGDIYALQSEVESMQDAAGDFEAYVGKQVQFVSSVDDVTDPDVIYGLVSDADANLFDLYILKNGVPTKIGSSSILVNGIKYYTGILQPSAWAGNQQTISIDGITSTDAADISPINEDASVYIASNVQAQQIVDGGIMFDCDRRPSVEIRVVISVTTQEEAPTPNGYYTEIEVDAIAGNALQLSIDPTTYVMTVSLISVSGTVLSTQTVDLPLESVVVGGSYNDETKTIVLTLQNGETVNIPVGDLVDGLATQQALDDVIDGITPVAKATNADTASTSDKVSNKLTITRDGQPYKEYDGSDGVSIDIPSGETTTSTYDVTLTVAGWMDDRQDISIEAVTQQSSVTVYPKDVSAAAYVISDIMISQAVGKVIFTCTTVPTTDINVVVEIA